MLKLYDFQLDPVYYINNLFIRNIDVNASDMIVKNKEIWPTNFI